MKIAVDIDDTLNILERVRYAGEYIRRNQLPFKLKDPDANAFVDVYDWTLDDVLKFVREGGGITAFTDAPVRKGAREALARWKEEGHGLPDQFYNRKGEWSDMKIAVDIDDTLNILERVRYAGEYIRRNQLPFKLKDPDANAFVDVYDWTLDDVLKFVREGGGITAFTDAPVRKGAREALARWKEEGHEIVILTSRLPSWFANPEKISRDWLEKRRIPYDELVADCQDKGKYCEEHHVDVLIDDRIEHCLAAQSRGVAAVLAVTKATVSRAREVRYGGANWKQIDMAVHHIAGLIARRNAL